MNNLLVLPSARLVPPELRADFGSIPSGMIPLSSQPALHHIIRHHAADCNNVVIGVHDSAHLVRNYISARPELRASCVDVGRTNSLGESIVAVLRAQPIPDTLTINFADTLVDDQLEGRDFICYQELSNVYRWTTFEKTPSGEIRGVVDKDRAKSINGKLPVFVGVFRFSRPASFLTYLEQCLMDPDPGVDPFYSAVIEYFNALPANAKRFIAVNNWKDLGHLDTYYSVKQSIFLNSRDFNSLDVDLRRGVIRKTSVNSSKLREEIKWYINLPTSVQHLIPRVFNYSVEPADTFVEMEFYGYPALNDVYLHGDWDLGIWSQVLDAIGAALDELGEHRQPGYCPAKNREALETMYIQKTRARLEPLLADSRFAPFTAGTVTVNGRECMGALGCLAKLPEIAQHLGLTEAREFSIIHGDFCLSNILYDRRSGFVRLIDPRGTFGNIPLYGDSRYELAKLSHSMEGDYDFLVNGLFDLTLGAEGITLTVSHRRSHRNIKRLFHAWLLRRAGADYLQVKLVESLLFFSMVPLHSDRPRSQQAYLVRAIELFQQVLDEIEQQSPYILDGNVLNETTITEYSHHYGR